jgi:hypothetical protein
MKFKKETISELKQILKEEFNLSLDKKDLEKLAYSLVGYFDLLMKIDNRHEFGNSPSEAIDTKVDSVLDKEEVK